MIFLELNKGSLDPMVPCCNTYRALKVSKEPQKDPFWFLVVFEIVPKHSLRKYKKSLLGSPKRVNFK